MAQPGSAFRSLRRKLLIPSLLLGATLACAGLFGISLARERSLVDGLHARAALIGNAIQYVVEGTSGASELQRIVSSMGTGDDIVDIVVVAGKPARVLATTQPSWIGKHLSELPGAEVGDDLAHAMRIRRSHTHFNFDERIFDYSAPLKVNQALLTGSVVTAGAVMVHLDIRPKQHESFVLALGSSIVFLVALTALSAFIYWRLEDVVLRPIAELVRRVRDHRQGASDVWAETTANDELGALALTLSEAVLRSDTALQDLANRKLALDQHNIVAVTDARGRIIDANERFCQISHYTREELIGQDHRIINSGHHPKDFFRVMWRTILRGDVWRGELRNRAKDGSLYWVDSSIVPVVGANGKPEQFISIRTDITERKRIEEALIAAKTAAEAASVAKSEFLANMSHEIRTPMNAVIATTGLLLDTQLDAGQRELVETARRGSEALLVIINDILDYSKIEAGKLTLEQRSFDVREVVESAVDLLGAQAADKNVDLVLEVEPAVPELLSGDEGRIRQILVNFVSNALKFTELGQVVVHVDCQTCSADVAEVSFSVRDSGMGIPPDKLGRLFHAFTQVDSSATRRVGGTGLGLAICRRLAGMMGGSVGVESEVNVGSTFTFKCRFPIAPSTRRPERTAQQSFVGKRFLVVDDNAACRSFVMRQLVGGGASVAVASSGAEALEQLSRDEGFDAVLLDQHMPTLAGRELAQKVRQLPGLQRLPLVLLSSRSVAARELTTEGFAAVACKPLRPHMLNAAVMKALAPAGTASADVSTSAPTHVLDGELSLKHPLRILLAEDNPVNQRVATLVFARMGYRIDVARDGVEAVAAFQARDYDLVFMDVHMPEMDGLEATRRIRELVQPRAHKPWIVALTASAMEDERNATTAAGMDDFVSKPVRVDDLQRAVLHAAECLKDRTA